MKDKKYKNFHQIGKSGDIYHDKNRNAYYQMNENFNGNPYLEGWIFPPPPESNLYWSYIDLDRYSLQSWMAEIPEYIKINCLSIPGTHDSSTYVYGNELKEGWVKTQEMNISTQLSSGIRYLDLRCSTDTDGTIWMCHDTYRFKLRLTQVLSDIKTFLDKNKSEFVLIAVKREDTKRNNVSDKEFSTFFNDALLKSNTHGMTIQNNEDIYMKDARGKIIVVSRVSGLSGLQYSDMDIEDWSEGAIFTQYIEKKERLIKDHIDKSIANTNITDRNFFLTYTSINPDGDIFETNYHISWYINSDIDAFIAQKFKERGMNRPCIGIIIMDYADLKYGLIQDTIKFNDEIQVSGEAGRRYYSNMQFNI